MAAVFRSLSSPSVPRSGGLAGEVVEVLCVLGLTGEAAVAVNQQAFVPGRLPRSAGVGSAAGGDVSGWLYRSPGARSLEFSSLSTASSLVTKMADQDRRLSNPLRFRRAIRKNEDDDFPSAMMLQIVKAWPAREEFGGSGGAARPRLAAASVVGWFLRDRNTPQRTTPTQPAGHAHLTGSPPPRQSRGEAEAAGNGQQHRRAAQGCQGDAAGRHGVPGEAAGVRGRGAARPPGLPAPRIRAGQAAGRPRAPAGARSAAPPGPALLPRRAAEARRAPAPRLVRRAPRRRARAARVAHAHAPLHLRPHFPHRHRASLASRLRRRACAAQDAPAKGAAGQAHGREPGLRRGRRQDHAALRRQRGRERRRYAGEVRATDAREVRAADARAEPAVRAHAGLGYRCSAPADARAQPAVRAHARLGLRQVLPDAGAEPEVRRDARVGRQVHDADAGERYRHDGEDAGREVVRANRHAGRQGQPEGEANAVRRLTRRDNRLTVPALKRGELIHRKNVGAPSA